MTRKVRAAKSTTAVNGRQAVMFGPCKSDEQSILMIGGSDTSILWAAIPSKPTPERGSRKLEGRKQEKHVAIHCSRLMIDAHSWVQNPAYRYAIILLITTLMSLMSLKTSKD